MRYKYNPYCSCSRCRAHGFMGPAVLITIGVLFLLDQVGHAGWMDFGSTWPALLIVIGLILFLEHNASASGHIPREYGAMPPGQPGQPIVPGNPQYPVHPQNPYPGAPGTAGPIVTPPPVPPAGSITPANYPPGPEDPGVHHG